MHLNESRVETKLFAGENHQRSSEQPCLVRLLSLPHIAPLLRCPRSLLRSSGSSPCLISPPPAPGNILCKRWADDNRIGQNTQTTPPPLGHALQRQVTSAGFSLTRITKNMNFSWSVCVLLHTDPNACYGCHGYCLCRCVTMATLHYLSTTPQLVFHKSRPGLELI